MPGENRSWLTYSLLLAVLLLTAVILSPALTGGFIFDDYPIFAENPVVHVAGWHWQAWHDLWAWSVTNIQRPLAMATYAVNYAFGADTFGFKATNLGLHLLNAVLVFVFTRRLLDACWRPAPTDTRRIDCWALAITLAWAIHPLQVSTVMYVVQRMEMLGFTFTLLALLAYWRARQCQLQQRQAWPWLGLCASLVVIGYSAKETVVLVPCYALLLELLIFRFQAARPATARAWKFCYLSGVLAALVLALFYFGPHYTNAAVYAGRYYTPSQRELTQLRALALYLGWSVWPLPAQLHFYYDNYLASTGLFHPLTTCLSGLLLAGLIGLAVICRHRRPLLALGIGWFFVAHALTSSPLPLELVFEHRNYPALLGVMLALADIVWLLNVRVHPRIPLLLGAFFIANLGVFSVLRAATWGSPLQLAMSLAQNNPGSSRAALDLARRYVAMSGNDPARPIYELGINELKRAAALPQSSALPEEALLIQAALHPSSAADSAHWWGSLRYKLRTEPWLPDNYKVLYHLLLQRLSTLPNLDARQLSGAFQEAIARNPTRVSLHVQYAELAARALGDTELAGRQWRIVVTLQKADSDYVLQLGDYLADNHRTAEAAVVLDETLRQRPELQHNAAVIALEARIRGANAPAVSHPT